MGKRKFDILTPELMEQRKQAEQEAQQQFPCNPESPNWVGSLECEDATFADTLESVIETIQMADSGVKPNQVRKQLLEKGYVDKHDNWSIPWSIQWNPKLAERLRSL